MSEELQGKKALKRRDVLALLGSAAATIAAGCSSGSSATGTGGAGGTGTATGVGGAGGGAASVPWASGGTAAMTAKASYPNPFAAGPAATCPLTCEIMLGPCYSSQSVEIQDISYGYPGLPMRFYLQVLDDACQPVKGALVDIWHVSAVGKYSGNDPVNEQVSFCTGDDPDFTSHLYFRGKQTTDDKGVVFFDSCFPGWYAGRTLHIHVTISVGGQGYLTTQILFPDALSDEIISGQPLYKDRGARDTTNQNDGAVSASAASDYIVEYQKMSDGAMLAWKTLVIRSSLSDASCTAPSGSSGGMDGGPPPGWDGGPPPGWDGGPPPDAG
jgi:protocatechuate 3,4-dioxygenase beta subunit